MKNKLFFVKILLFFSGFLLFFSCSCEKQLHKLSYRCPELFENKKIRDTTIIPEYKFDTTYVLSPGSVDTFTIIKDRVEVKIIRHVDTLETFIKIPADTIVKTIEVEVSKPVIVKQKSLFENIKDVILAAAVCGLIYLLIVLLKPKRNEEKK